MKQNTKKILFFACIFILFFMAFQKNNLYEGNQRRRERKRRRRERIASLPPRTIQITNTQSNQQQQVSVGATHTGSY
jgi:hypothetical protein